MIIDQPIKIPAEQFEDEISSILDQDKLQAQAVNKPPTFIEDQIVADIKAGKEVTNFPNNRRILTLALVAAVQSKNEVVIDKLYSDKRLDLTIDDKQKLFDLACRSKDAHLIKKILDDRNINPAKNCSSALRWAAENGHIEILQLLLNESRFSPEANYNYVIRVAAQHGHLEVVKLLLNDQRVNQKVNSGYAFSVAAASGHLEIVKLLLNDRRVDPAADNNYAIRGAADNGRIEIVKLLLNDQRVNQKVNDGYAFSVAAASGHLEIVKLLLNDRRVDPAAENNYAIRGAADNGHIEIVKLLLDDNRVDPAAENNNAIRAAAGNGHIEVVKLLLNDERVDPAAEYNNAIKAAAAKGHLEIIILLLSCARVNPAANNNSAIRGAAEFGHLEVVKILLNDQRVDPAADDNHAIIWAAHNGHLEVVKTLLNDQRVDPAANNNLAIKSASECGHLEIVKVLLNDKRVTPALNSYAIICAALNGHLEVARTLLNDSRINPAANNNDAIKAARANRHIEMVALLLDDKRVAESITLDDLIKFKPEGRAHQLQDNLIELDLLLWAGGFGHKNKGAIHPYSLHLYDSLSRYVNNPTIREKVNLDTLSKESLTCLTKLAAYCEFYSNQIGTDSGESFFIREIDNHKGRNWNNHLEQFLAATKDIVHAKDMLTSLIDGTLLPIAADHKRRTEQTNDFDISQLRASSLKFVKESIVSRLSLPEIARISRLWHRPDKRQAINERPLLNSLSWKKYFEGYKISDYTVYELNTHELLVEEGTALAHCVGDGSYSSSCLEGQSLIFSFRKNDSPQATMELRKDPAGNIITPDGNRWRLAQLLGKKNKAVSHEIKQLSERFISAINAHLVPKAKEEILPSLNPLYALSELEKITGVPLDRDPRYLLDYWLKLSLRSHSDNKIISWFLPQQLTAEYCAKVISERVV